MDSEKNHLNLLEENFVNKFLETVEEFKKPNNKQVFEKLAHGILSKDGFKKKIKLINWQHNYGICYKKIFSALLEKLIVMILMIIIMMIMMILILKICYKYVK